MIISLSNNDLMTASITIHDIRRPFFDQNVEEENNA